MSTAKNVTTKAGLAKVPSAEPEPEGNDGDDEGEEEVVKLNPKQHSLLRTAAAGTVLKTARAEVDNAVGLVFDDLFGRGLDPDRQLRSLQAANIDHRRKDNEESEEDELEY